MSSLFFKVNCYLKANSKTWNEEEENIKLVNEGSGDYIHTWNVSGLAKPTDEQLASFETQANTDKTNAVIDETRRTQYLSWQQQMEMIYKDQKNGTTTFKDHCDKVRSDNPKE
tara:strand:+ start:519 stop:857 length:339 start_codon:yes stop_codon:yes gene_type:complete